MAHQAGDGLRGGGLSGAQQRSVALGITVFDVRTRLYQFPADTRIMDPVEEVASRAYGFRGRPFERRRPVRSSRSFCTAHSKRLISDAGGWLTSKGSMSMPSVSSRWNGPRPQPPFYRIPPLKKGFVLPRTNLYPRPPKKRPPSRYLHKTSITPRHEEVRMDHTARATAEEATETVSLTEDPEFRQLIPPLRTEEFEELEKVHPRTRVPGRDRRMGGPWRHYRRPYPVRHLPDPRHSLRHQGAAVRKQG